MTLGDFAAIAGIVAAFGVPTLGYIIRMESRVSAIEAELRVGPRTRRVDFREHAR